MELTDVSEYLNVKQTTTAAASPNQNRRNERNHAVVDCMKSKIMEVNKTLEPKMALC